MKSGVQLIADERFRQINAEGWTSKHDSAHFQGELAIAAACYALPIRFRQREVEYMGSAATSRCGLKIGPLLGMLWPFELRWWKPTPDNRIRELAKAGALCAAEIDRLQRTAILGERGQEARKT